MAKDKRSYNGPYAGEYLAKVAFPMGGIGSGMVCMEGTGKLSHVSVRHKPDVYNEPLTFAAVSLKGTESGARVLEGPVPGWKIFFPWGAQQGSSGNGGRGKDYGLPRFSECTFEPRFPFATVKLHDADLPLDATITGWSPFIPANADDSSLPAAGLEYTLTNTSKETQEGVFYFSSVNFMALDPRIRGMRRSNGQVRSTSGGFVLHADPSEDNPADEGDFAVVCTDPGTVVNHVLFRGGWFDTLTMLWNDIEGAETREQPPETGELSSPGASLSVPFSLKAGESTTFRVLLTWYVPCSDVAFGQEAADAADGGSCCRRADGTASYRPWYAERFPSVAEAARYWQDSYDRLRNESMAFSECFYDSTLAPEVVEAVAANLTILKSPTVLRQHDGRLWAWEGCCDDVGCCPGSCTHVWNYAQALPHLFPSLERTLRDVEFNETQDAAGHQTFRAPLPIRRVQGAGLAAADGQLGGIMKVYREWRINGDLEWLRSMWKPVQQSLDYCIETWDPDHLGVVVEPHHNTYDIEFWGPDGMCSSFYLGALKAASLMGAALEQDVTRYDELLAKGRRYMEDKLYNGEYFIQDVQWKGLRAGDPTEAKSLIGQNYASPEAQDLLQKEGPKYQYGNGCLSDGVLGAWIAATAGIDDVLDDAKVASHLRAIHAYNYRENLRLHPNPQRPTYALGEEGGLLLCSWPHDDAPSLPFVYSNEVWTGIEYQVASHLIMMGAVEEGLDIVRACRDRYDGRVRNPFNEYECGHWYARAMASYGLLQSLSGARYDAVEKVLYLRPTVKGDFRSFLSTEGGYGTVGVRDGKPFLDVRGGAIDVTRIDYEPAG